MASKTLVQLIDDIDGGTAHQQVDFALDGVTYTIDLSDTHAERLRELLNGYIPRARRLGGRKHQPRTVANGVLPGPVKTGPPASVVREWARDNGIDMPDRGRIPIVVLDAYHEAQANPTPEPAPAAKSTGRGGARTRQRVESRAKTTGAARPVKTRTTTARRTGRG